MLTRKLGLVLVLAIFTPMMIGPGCGGSSSSTGTGGKGGKDGGAGTGAAGTSAAGTSAAGTSAAGTSAAGTSAAGTMGVDAAAGTGAAGTGTDGGMDMSAEPMPPPKPDGAQGVSYLFDTMVQGWKYSIYGSTPNGMPNSPMNLATLSGAPVWDMTNDVDNKTTSGSLKGTVQFRAVGDRIDFQAFSVGAGMYDWTGYKVAAKVKLVSGGNLTPGCPLKAYIYLSGPMPTYTTITATPADLVTGTWVTLNYDTDIGAAGGVDLTKISQLGIQIDTGMACVGVAQDGGTDAASDASSDASSDAADGGASDASDDGGADGGVDASDAVIPAPPTASTAVILIDSVIVSVK